MIVGQVKLFYLSWQNAGCLTVISVTHALSRVKKSSHSQRSTVFGRDTCIEETPVKTRSSYCPLTCNCQQCWDETPVKKRHLYRRDTCKDKVFLLSPHMQCWDETPVKKRQCKNKVVLLSHHHTQLSTLFGRDTCKEETPVKTKSSYCPFTVIHQIVVTTPIKRTPLMEELSYCSLAGCQLASVIF